MRKQEIARKCRGQRISHGELVAEAQQKLRESGVGNHERAMFITELSKAVVGDDCPLLCQLQPKVKIRTSAAWSRAYDLAFKFIAEHNLGFTLETINVECGDAKQRLESAINNISHSGAQLGELLRRGGSDSESEPFQARVNRYRVRTSDQATQHTPERKRPVRASPAVAADKKPPVRAKPQPAKIAPKRGQQAVARGKDEDKKAKVHRIGHKAADSTESDVQSQAPSDVELSEKDLNDEGEFSDL